MVLLFIACLLFLVALLLLFHHAYIHGPHTEHELTGMDQYFQLSDVGNFHLCSHEMWIMLIATVVILLVVAHAVLLLTELLKLRS